MAQRVRSLLPILLFVSIGSAQKLRIGVEGGIPLTDAFSTGSIYIAMVYPPISAPSYHTATRRYTVGATAEVELPCHLAVKGDVLYRRLGYDFFSVAGFTTTWAPTTANSWEIPLLAKYRFGKLGPVQPYVEGGFAFRTIQGARQRSVTVGPAAGSSMTTSHPAELSNRFTQGIAAGGGIEIRHRPVVFFGEVRYTHWTADAFSTSYDLLKSVRNQADLLVGVTF